MTLLVKNPPTNIGDSRDVNSIPGRIPWRRKWQSTPVWRFAIAFLPRSKHLLISWLQTLSVVILEPKEIKSATVSNFSPSICHVVMGPDAMILVFWMWLASELASKVSRSGINMLNLVPAGVWILNPMEVAQTRVIFVVVFRPVTWAMHALGLLHMF